MQSSAKIKKINEPNEKTAITKQIMHALPQWFSPPEDIEKKAVTHRDYPFFAAFDGDKCIGFIALKIHNEFTADIYVIGVLAEYHKQGIGGRLIEAAEAFCRAEGHIYLTVKTLDARAHYLPYEATRSFYRRMGFIPLEVFTTLWDEDNPCLFLVKDLRIEEGEHYAQNKKKAGF